MKDSTVLFFFFFYQEQIIVSLCFKHRKSIPNTSNFGFDDAFWEAFLLSLLEGNNNDSQSLITHFSLYGRVYVLQSQSLPSSPEISW